MPVSPFKFNPASITVYRLAGSPAILGSFKLGVSQLGNTNFSLSTVKVSSINLEGGYDLTAKGRLSLDPITGQMAFAQRLSASTVFTSAMYAPPVMKGERIRIDYAGATFFEGYVTDVIVTVDRQLDGTWIRRWAYSIADFTYLLLTTPYVHGDIPAESWSDRLTRVFSINDYTNTRYFLGLRGVNWAAQAAAPALAADEEITYLDIARDFAEATGIPVRPYGTNAKTIYLNEEPIRYPGETPNFTVSYPGGTDATTYTENAEFDSAGICRKITVGQNDTRWLGRQLGIVINGLGQSTMAVARLKHDINVEEMQTELTVAPPLIFSGSPNN